MQYRELGVSGITVSAIALGCADLVDSQRFEPLADSPEQLIKAAIETGINCFDTGEVYADGDSERVLGLALQAFDRNSIIISSKVSDTNLKPDDLKQACEQSLQRLGTDYIDLYQMHWYNKDIPLADTAGALGELQASGKIRGWGVCNFGSRQIIDAGGLGNCVSNQVSYSLLFRAIEYSILPVCQKNNISITCYCPLTMGLLAGVYKDASQVPAPLARSRHFNSNRPLIKDHDEPGCEDLLFEAISTLEQIASEADLSLSQLSLAWLLAQQGIASTVVGARSIKQLQENTIAGTILLPDTVINAASSATEKLKTALGSNADMWRSNSRLQ